MPSNIEIKARVKDPARRRRLAERLSDTPAEVIEQRDTFFACAHGRLKLRQFAAGPGELIAYARADVAGVKQSDYAIARVAEPAALLAVLTAALGVRRTVRKTRVLFKSGQTRIHLDAVTGLGDFIELEVVLRDGQSAGEGRQMARDLMRALEIREEDLVAGAYADLLAPEQNG